MKAREQSNVNRRVFLVWETRIMRDETVWLFISGKGSKRCQLEEVKGKASVVYFSFAPSFLQNF